MNFRELSSDFSAPSDQYAAKMRGVLQLGGFLSAIALSQGIGGQCLIYPKNTCLSIHVIYIKSLIVGSV